MRNEILVLGAGAWGTAIANLLADNCNKKIFLWAFGSRDVFNLVRAAFLTNIMVPKSKNLGFGPEIKDS